MKEMEFDRTGFPLVFVSALNLYAHLLPVTKAQFEEWLLLPDTPGDCFYDEAQIIRQRIEAARTARLRRNRGEWAGNCNERISWRHCGADPTSYPRLLMTGILPTEAQRFAQWIGPDYDLPTIGEWRGIARSWEHREPIVPFRRDSLVANVWHTLYEAIRPRTLLDQSMMTSGGVMEWIWDDRKERILWLGRPHEDFFPNTFRPMQYDPPMPRATSDRLWFCGFRLVRRRA